MPEEATTTVAVAEKPRPPIAMSNRGIQLENLDALVRFSQILARSGLAPKGMQTPEAICIAVQMGLEVGLTPMAALQNIAVINGRPTIWGDAQLGIVRGTGELEEFDEWYEVGGKRVSRNPSTFTDDTAAVCKVKRRGYPAVETGFSVGDAKRANLWGKQGPWEQYPARMLRFRARSFGLRDTFGDALRGIKTTEEAQDERDVTPIHSSDSAMEMMSEPDAALSALPAPAPESEKEIIKRAGTKKEPVTPKVTAPAPAPVAVTPKVTAPAPIIVEAPADTVPAPERLKEAMESDGLRLQDVANYARANKLTRQGSIISVYDFDDAVIETMLADWDNVREGAAK